MSSKKAKKKYYYAYHKVAPTKSELLKQSKEYFIFIDESGRQYYIMQTETDREDRPEYYECFILLNSLYAPLPKSANKYKSNPQSMQFPSNGTRLRLRLKSRLGVLVRNHNTGKYDATISGVYHGEKKATGKGKLYFQDEFPHL
jgi:hypothetical protein